LWEYIPELPEFLYRRSDLESELSELFVITYFMIIVGWNTVAIWKWLANDDKCGICRAPFDGCCSDCKVPGDDCPLGNLIHIHDVFLEQRSYIDIFDVYLHYSLGSLFSLFSHALYHEVAGSSTKSDMSNVPTGLGSQIGIIKKAILL
jgi:hypothetical protein